MSRSTSSSSSSKEAPAWVLALFVGLCLVFGALGTWFLLVRPLSLLWEARGWEARDCEVLSSHVRRHDSDDGEDTYSIDIEYRYEVDGRVHTSDRYDFMGGSSSGYAGKAAVVERHPPGATVTCWVDPEDPSQAVLDRSFRAVYLIGLFPLVFLAIGVGGFFVWITSKRSAEPFKRAALEAEFRDAQQVGPKVLEPPVGPVGKVVGALFIALFWNGIVSVFLYQEYLAWRHGEGLAFGCGTLFLIPFVLVGLLLVVVVFSAVLALVNPRPRLILDPRSPEVGDTATLRWELTGAVGRIRRWKILLRGLETRSSSDNDGATHEETFYEETLLNTEQPLQMRQGSLTLTVPADQPPTARDSHRQTMWLLSVHGDIAFWPDVLEEFPLEVRPAEVE